MTLPRYTLQVNRSALGTIASSIVCALLGLLAGYGFFSRPAASAMAVPDEALGPAKMGGTAILTAAAPGNLDAAVFTPGFTQQYSIDYRSFIQPMGNQGPIIWVGTPAVTWVGDRFIDIALPARTRAGIAVLELRMVRPTGEEWKIDSLLSIQLREEIK